jgi:hypothetical protein
MRMPFSAQSRSIRLSRFAMFAIVLDARDSGRSIRIIGRRASKGKAED